MHFTPVYTDGSYRQEPPVGGWGWVVPGPGAGSSWACGNHIGKQGSSTGMELKAAVDAVCNVEGPVVVYCDSKSMVDMIRARWWIPVRERGWKVRSDPSRRVRFWSLWDALAGEADKRPVNAVWVRGHSHNYWNDMAHCLARRYLDSSSELVARSADVPARGSGTKRGR